ncbi:PhnD/SsuA/transferrin family substrate-binding protein [Spiroplasma cantharicola]|uniref:Phosphonate ABC transporter phosphonate-binding protein n=1 Tax=Spiroplasma cantharicola TaxID=362837 RepID=A0A0M4KBU1_9MOLU|nr:PhnD/SsuA/transferrin family substrate-binding protein [Spiroplasma cantharicola]ALD66102.1 phosphonate ABC transporter phosphonate-binding protein [Spiroplasma cantharicola]
MKKLLSILGSASIVVSSGTYVIACNPNKDTINILFVPSQNSTEIINTVKPLEEKLANELAKIAQADNRISTKKVKIAPSTSYEVAGKTLQDGKAHLAFLPVNTYAKYRGQEKDKAFDKEGILLNASRAGAKPETTFSQFLDEQNKFNLSLAMEEVTSEASLELSKHYNKMVKDNPEEVKTQESAKKLLLDQDNEVSYYRSYIYANNKFLSDNQFDINSFENGEEYKAALKELILKGAKDKKFQFTFGASKTSSSGVLYPMLWLQDVLGIEDNELKDLWQNKHEQGSYPQASQEVSNATSNYAVGFSDIRMESKSSTDVENAFKNTTVIGATEPIVNDLIAYSKKTIKDEIFKNDLRTAFKNLIADKDNASIFEIYNHTGYVGPINIENSNDFEIATDKTITDTTNSTQALLDKMKNW